VELTGTDFEVCPTEMLGNVAKACEKACESSPLRVGALRASVPAA
jgi:hypothetical protein